jgi:hypothetical protein
VGSNPASRTRNSSQINGLASQELARFSLSVLLACYCVRQALDPRDRFSSAEAPSKGDSSVLFSASWPVLFIAVGEGERVPEDRVNWTAPVGSVARTDWVDELTAETRWCVATRGTPGRLRHPRRAEHRQAVRRRDAAARAGDARLRRRHRHRLPRQAGAGATEGAPADARALARAGRHLAHRHCLRHRLRRHLITRPTTPAATARPRPWRPPSGHAGRRTRGRRVFAAAGTACWASSPRASIDRR